MGMYAKYTPIRANFDLAPNLTPSNNKLYSLMEVVVGSVSMGFDELLRVNMIVPHNYLYLPITPHRTIPPQKITNSNFR